MEQSLSVYETLKMVREFLSDETRWTRGLFARNANGEMAFINDEEACQWCLVGAITKVCSGTFNATNVILRAQRYLHLQLDSEYDSLGGFNDQVEHKNILEFLDRTIETMESDKCMDKDEDVIL